MELTDENPTSVEDQPSALVVWITGLSGAGKTTLATEIRRRMLDQGQKALLLDGDEVREVFADPRGSATAIGREDRIQFGHRYGRLGRLVARQGINAIVSTISLAREVHDWNRANIRNYVEIYLRVPLEELRRRDPKGIYRRYDSGQGSNVWGLDIPFDELQNPDLIVDFRPDVSAVAIADQVMPILQDRLRALNRS